MKTELQRTLCQKDFDELTQALKMAFDNHLQWLSDFNFAMVCQPDKLPEFCCNKKPHRLCKFGLWYYNVINPAILTNIDFINLGKKHKNLHYATCKLVEEFRDLGRPNKTTYLEFKQLEELFLDEIKSFLYTNLVAFRDTDHLTELPNRHALDIFLKQEYNRIKREKKQSSIAMLDLDNFKLINDQYGHSIGDEVLKTFSDLLSSNIRNCDFVARYGGEEFIIYFANINCKATYTIAEKLRNLIQQKHIQIDDDRFITLTCSFGIASFNISKTIKDAIADADKALYQAKNTGRNNVKINTQE